MVRVRVWRRAGRAALVALALLAAAMVLSTASTTTAHAVSVSGSTAPPSRLTLLRRALFPSPQSKQKLLSVVDDHSGVLPDAADGNVATPGAGRALSSKAIVVGRRSNEDVSWIRKELPDFEAFIYTVDDPAAPGTLHTPNKGREAMPYLTYLVDNYDNLSDTIAFLHAHRGGFPQAWHVDNQDYSNVDSMRWLNLSHVQATGYANLRCNPAVGCPAEMRLDRAPAAPDRAAERAMPAAFAALMGPDVPVPPVVAQPCCAQFAVSRAQVRRRPRADYVRYRRWLLDTPLPDEVSGRILEYMWHIIFGKDPVFCPDMETCYCNLYGACLDA